MNSEYAVHTSVFTKYPLSHTVDHKKSSKWQVWGPFIHELYTYYGHKLQFSFCCGLVKKDAEKAEREAQTPDPTHQLPWPHSEGSVQLFCTLEPLAECGTVDMWLRGEEPVVLGGVQKWAVFLPLPMEPWNEKCTWH